MKVDSSKKSRSRGRKYPSSIVVTITARKNTHITFSRQDNSTIVVVSGGTGGQLENSRKKTSHAAEQAALTAGKMLKEGGVEDCEVTIKGTGNGKEGAVKGISDAGIRVLKLIDQTGFPHNGCRQSKRKRN